LLVYEMRAIRQSHSLIKLDTALTERREYAANMGHELLNDEQENET